MASQESADRASEEADRINAVASARALEAIKQSGALSGQLRQQDFGIEQAKASSQDEFDRFNVQNQIALNQRNTASQNQAQAVNLAEKQRIADSNVQLNNTEKQRQVQAERDYWNDKLMYAQAKANPYAAQANMAMNSGQAKANSAQAMGSGIGSAFGSLGTYLAKNKANTPKNSYSYTGFL